jgi:hypothetical protein
MSDAPFGGPPPAPQGSHQPADVPQAPNPSHPYHLPPPTQVTEPRGRPSAAPLALVSIVAALALGLAIADWFKPAGGEGQSSASAPTQTEVDEAKDAVCAAWDASLRAVSTSGRKSSTDETVNYVLGLRTQLAFYVGADRLRSELQRHPATPDRLAKATERLASANEQLVLARLSDAAESDVEPIRIQIGEAEAEVRQECND